MVSVTSGLNWRALVAVQSEWVKTAKLLSIRVRDACRPLMVMVVLLMTKSAPSQLVSFVDRGMEIEKMVTVESELSSMHTERTA